MPSNKAMMQVKRSLNYKVPRALPGGIYVESVTGLKRIARIFDNLTSLEYNKTQTVEVGKMTMLATEVLDKVNEVNVLTERVKRRIKEFREAKAFVSSNRACLWVESWKETESEPTIIRRAKGFQKVLQQIPIVIREGELIVGSQTEHIRGCFAYPEWDANVGVKELGTKGHFTRTEDYFECDSEEEERRKILECANFWKGKSVTEKIWNVLEGLWGSKMRELFEARVWFNPFGKPPSGGTVDYPKVINKGLNGVIAEVREQLDKAKDLSKEGLHRFHVWQAMIIACEAMIDYAKRHADLARELAKQEANEVRREELLRIAEICDWVPANPARNFHEALQSFWFVHLGLHQEVPSAAKSPGRFDQYLYPFYEADIEKGRFSRQEASELLALLWVKFNEMLNFSPGILSEFAEATMLQNLTIGGVTRDGTDATNELSYLILELEQQLKVPQPQLSLRYHDGLSEEFLVKAVETNRDIGGGKPAFYNDKVTLLGLCQDGIPLADARDWAPQGCVERYVQFSSGGFRKANINLAKVLELALNNGVDPRTGKQISPATGDPKGFSSLDEFYEALKKQAAYVIESVCNMWTVGQIVRGEEYPIPFYSSLINDCIEKGLDVMEGGFRYNQLFSTIDIIGHQNVANSLAAIKKVIFEDKAITMAELLDALAVNFEGKENIQAILKAAPKYGNDDDYVDDFMVDIFRWTKEMVNQHTSPWGYPWGIVRKGLTAHQYFGRAVGALPEGRKAGEPLADGAVSPMRGTDTSGPTAVLNSAAKVDHVGSEAVLLNLKFLSSTLGSKGLIRKFLSLIKTYFDHYGYHIQCNIFDPQTLIDAKKHPERYKDLVVRVAGYSAYFVDLSPGVQDEIISRTVHTL